MKAIGFQLVYNRVFKTKRVQNTNDKLDKECIYAVVNKPRKNIENQEVNEMSPS